ncbi:unnamed protein product [Mytilus coruscus]|uniref:Retrotransposon gag domain-containing protein n=1 Tax=Mytilus coruscus TaxID=42192 RepID=A0A6J8DQH6_MYTCO|nr:unnamed protein product [Mytilus coruscus]
MLVQKLSQRFGNKDLPHTIRRQLQEVRQFVDESIEEFSERIQELATDCYLNTPENVVDTIAVDAFLKGCTDKKASLFAMEKDPNTMDQALQYVKSSIHNQKILLGYRKPEIKRVQFYDDSDEESTECLLRQVKTGNNQCMQDLQKKELKPEALGKKQVTISDSSAVHCNLTDFNNGQKKGSENDIDNPQLREIQLYPGDRNPESNTLVLSISINDVTVNAVIDRAAQVTLMSEET